MEDPIIEEIGVEEVDLCAKYLAGGCVQTNAESLTYTLTGFTLKGVPHGDWKITCRRIKKPAPNSKQ